MKNASYLFIFLGSLILTSCKDKKNTVLEESVGEINQITIIIDDFLWNGEVGDSIRKKLTTTINGLPQEEPLFNLVQHTDKNGDDHFCKNRNIIIVEKSIDSSFEIRNDDFALNQSVIYLSGKNIPEIINLLEKKSDSMISAIHSYEIIEAQKRIALSPANTNRITSKFDISIDVPSDFEYVSEDEKFIWMKKEEQNGSSSLLIYQVPYFEFESQTDNINKIIKTRDSIGACYIQSQEDKKEGFMITEEAYTPYFSTTRLANRKAFHTKGTWELKGVFMSGPFINYAVLDKEKNRIIVLEGFSYAPSSSKRNTMHQLEAIIKSVKIN